MAQPDNFSKTMFNSPQFTKMYKSAENVTGIWGLELLQRTGFEKDLANKDKVVVLDNACGTGIVSTHIMNMVNDSNAAKIDLTCADFAESMVNVVKERIETTPWPNTKAVIADVQDTKLPSSNFTHIFFCFGPQLIPEPMKAISECHRMLQPGAVLGVTSWQSVGWLEDFANAFKTNPSLPQIPSMEDFVQGFSKQPWNAPELAAEHLRSGGFVDVEAVAVPGQSKTESVEEVTAMFPGMLGIIIKVLWTEEQTKTHKEEATKTVTSYLHEKYKDGPVEWNWVGIVAWGKKSE